MIQELQVTNFRNYSRRKFNFGEESTLIIGPNAIGKTNILEAIYLLSSGKSFRAEKEMELVSEGEMVSRVMGKTDRGELEVDLDGRERFHKVYKVNGVGKRQVDFVGNLLTVLFAPTDLEIVIDSPSVRRKYLDGVLSQVHKDYRLAINIYEKALRQRNRILWKARDAGMAVGEIRSGLEYWDSLLVAQGTVIHERRREYLKFLNSRPSRIMEFNLHFEHSIISYERLEKYREEELAAATTLVGPHRDEFLIFIKSGSKKEREAKLFGSRGEQRLVVFAMKLGELDFIKETAGKEPVLLLDDIFSELDIENRQRLLEVIPQQQTIMTTTDLHLLDKGYLKKISVVELS